MLQSEAQRGRVTTLPESTWRYPVAGLIDQERRQALLTTPGSRETAYFLTLTWYPPPPSTRFSAPIRIDLPAPVSPVMMLRPG